jgi:putative ABC transport system substrate-binding protein
MTSGPDSDPVLAIVRRKLAELGYVEGQNIRFEYRGAYGQVDRLPSLAEELVHLNVDVIVAVATPEVQAAHQATRKIPIVMVAVVDPVASGLVASLARPGGNITGLSLLSAELSGKRLELLKEVVPGVSRVAVLWNPTNPSNALQIGATKVAAQALGVQLQPLEVRGPQDLERAFQAATRGRAGALIALDDPVLVTHRTRIVTRAAKIRLPAMYGLTGYAKVGGLMTYGPNIPDLFRQAAVFVGKILKGAKPADLPVEQPTKFELVINLKTARALGLAIPESILLRADEVIR